MKNKEKLKVSEIKAKKMVEATSEAKRKHNMWMDKQKEVDAMRQACKETNDLKEKLQKIKATNSDLVTRKCALESACTAKDKTI
jgi:succinate dehydrogenase/fumarate reductase flavoprotein subunit